MERMLRATINSWNGLIAATRSEQAFREELVLLAVAIPLAFLVAEEAWIRLFLIALVVLVLIVELLNTAIEKLADQITREADPRIGRIKDMGSAAVGLTLLLTLAGWLWALGHRLLSL
jgi:diacylglycerol kinase (ATP)